VGIGRQIGVSWGEQNALRAYFDVGGAHWLALLTCRRRRNCTI
jgi:hypothetical protein